MWFEVGLSVKRLRNTWRSCERFKCPESSNIGVCTPLNLRMRVQCSMVEFNKCVFSWLGASIVSASTLGPPEG